MYDRNDAMLGRAFNAIGKGKESVRSHHGALCFLAGFVAGQQHRIDAAHLAGPNPNGRLIFDIDNGITLDIARNPPGKRQIGQLNKGGLLFTDHLPLERIHIHLALIQRLDEEATVDAAHTQWTQGHTGWLQNAHILLAA